jgi:hypothetical protein
VPRKLETPVDIHWLFTIEEETGIGASSILSHDIAAMVAVDNGTTAPGQGSREFGVTICMADQTGPFDWHLTKKLVELCRDNDIVYQKDVFRITARIRRRPSWPASTCAPRSSPSASTPPTAMSASTCTRCARRRAADGLCHEPRRDRPRLCLISRGRGLAGSVTAVARISPELAVVGQRFIQLGGGAPSRPATFCKREAALISRFASSSRGLWLTWAFFA